MSSSLKEICDQYIERCEDVLHTRDMDEARKLRADATRQFHSVIPRWSAGLMASITHYYLDDIENILGKIKTLRKQVESEGDRWITASPAASAARMHHHQRRLTDSFEQTCNWIREAYIASSTEKADIIQRVQELQKIAVSQDTLGERWEKMRGLIEWLQMKNADLAARLLPLLAEALGHQRI